MIRTAIVDDEPLARAGVRAHLSRQADVEIVGEYADGDSALAGLSQRTVDLVFLDIEMPSKSGLEMLASLPASIRPIAILLTAHETFAVRAFALGVVDYLLKPIDSERFAEALARVRQQLNAKNLVEEKSRKWPERFSVRVGHVSRYVAAENIRWVGAEGDYVCLHTETGAHLLRESLQEFVHQLNPKHFVRVHRSAIVAIKHISEMRALTNRDALLRLSDGTPVRVSRNYIDGLLLALQK